MDSATKAEISKLINTYRFDIAIYGVQTPKTVPVWWSNTPVTLDCIHLNPDKLPPRFLKSRQYDLRLKIIQDLGYQERPKAWRVNFLLEAEYAKVEYTVSHLCHNPECYNWEHHVLELLAVNKARNGCPGGRHCHHKHKCLIPGPYSQC